jgi:excisionase family DNA binding protein
MDQILTSTTPAGTEPRLGRSVSLDQAAEVLQVSRRTIYNWIRDGRLQTIRTINGSQRVLADSLHDRARRMRAETRADARAARRQEYSEVGSI